MSFGDSINLYGGWSPMTTAGPSLTHFPSPYQFEVTGPNIQVVASEPGAITFCARHPDVKTSEWSTNYGWQGVCEKCSAETRRADMVRPR